MSKSADSLRGWAPSLSALQSIALLGAVAALAWVERAPALAVYSLSSWHYYLYWLAYRYGAIPQPVFKRDALLMKTAALGALGWVYFQAPLSGLSLAVTAGGFLLNAAGAWALGADRTYYGREVADLPEERITRFPFNVISHPMLIGNVVAFAGTMLNLDFLRQWWPLPVLHIAANLGLLLMERFVRPLRLGALRGAESARRGPRAWPSLLAAAVGIVLGVCVLGWTQGVSWPAAVLLGAALVSYAFGIWGCYRGGPLPVRATFFPATNRLGMRS